VSASWSGLMVKSMIDFIFVHYHAVEWLQAQARVFQICNPERNYRIIVADGTGTDDERDQLNELKQQGFIDALVLYKATEKDAARGIDGSFQHGEGMNLGFREVRSDIFCIQDSDFFFVASEFCKIAAEVLSQPRIVMFGPQHQVVLRRSWRSALKLWARNLIAPMFGKPRKNTWQSPIFLGTFCKTNLIRENNLSFEFSPSVWQSTNYDAAYKVHQHIDRYHPRGYVALRPQPMEEYRRGYMCAYLYRFQDADFGMHLLSGSSDRVCFKSEELYQQTLALRRQFMQDAIIRAQTSKGVTVS